MTADTIFALASGAPPAGVAVIRLSGPKAHHAVAALCGAIPPPRRASLRELADPATGAPLDRGLVLVFAAPRSFTGEDAAELHLHGGRAVIAAVLRALGALPGLRPADRGEFTRRALLGGRLDLTEVEGLADLVAAETEAQRRQAQRQADGELARTADGWRAELVAIRALVEAELDFVDEADVPDELAHGAFARAAALAERLDAALAGAAVAERLRDGLEVVLLGPPNAGKSSLLNALARRDVAIVTAEPGTTRDLIEVRLDCGGVPVTLVDTAGLREAEGLIEKEGMARATRRARAADLVLWLSEDAEPPPEHVGAGDAADASPPEVWPILTKIDLAPPRGAVFHVKHRISARTGEGLADLEQALAASAAAWFSPAEAALVTHARQRHAIVACRDHLRTAAGGHDRPLELRADDLRRAGDALGRLTGRIGVEDVLGAIFARFCIGK